MRVIAIAFVASSIWAADPLWLASAGGNIVRDKQGRIVAADLRSTWVNDSDLADLAKLPVLSKLDLSLTRISDRGMKDLTAAPSITELTLYYAEQIADEGVAAVKGWTKLRKVNLRGTKITDTSLEHLSGIRTLESIDVGFAQVTDNGLDNLASLPNLKEVTIGGNKLTDVGLQFLRQLPGLTYLDLSGTQRTDSGLWSISVTEAGLESIATLKELKELNLAGHIITARGLEKLKELKKLERLSLQGAKRIADDAVPVLASFKSLRLLDLNGTAMTEPAVVSLRAQLPSCDIVFP